MGGDRKAYSSRALSGRFPIPSLRWLPFWNLAVGAKGKNFTDFDDGDDQAETVQCFPVSSSGIASYAFKEFDSFYENEEYDEGLDSDD